MICRASSFVPPASLRIIVAGALLATGCETAPAVEESTTATQERLSFSANAWQASGPGNAVVSNADSALKFDYRLSGDAVWSSQTWTFSTTSDVEKTLAFNWSYSAYHAWYRVTANLEAFAEGPNGTTHVPLYSGGGGVMNASGTSTIAIHSGYRYGLRVTGSNYDRDTILTGSVIFAVPAPTKWTLGRVTNNTDAHVMFGLHVPKHGSVGVDALRDLTMVGLLIDGEGILGIDPRGELSGCANPVWRTPIKFGESAWSFYHNSGETLDITINPGPTFEFMPGSGGQVVAADQSPQCH